MMQLFKPLCFFLLSICFFSIFKAQAQSKYEDPYIEKLNRSFQFRKSLQVASFKLLRANTNEEKLFLNNCIIRAYTNMDNHDSILISMKYSMDLLPSVRDSELICNTYIRIGSGYQCNLNINKSTQYFLKAVKLAKKIDCKIILVKAYYELGQLITNQNLNLNLALHYLNLSIKYSNAEGYDINNTNFLIAKIHALFVRSNIYLNLDKIKESFNDLFISKTLLSKLPNNEYLLKDYYLRLSRNYTYIDDKKNYEKYINEALKISFAVNDSFSIVELYINMANVSFYFNDYYKAIYYSVKAENYNNKNNENLVLKIYMDSIISLSYQYIGDHQNALKYYKSFTELKNKYYEKSRINELHKLEILYKVEENEKKLALKSLEQTKDKATIQILFLIIFLSILILIIFFGYKYLDNKRKKIIFKNIENSDKEINLIKNWQEWRNNSKTLVSNDLMVLTEEVDNNFNNTPELENNLDADKSEINNGVIGENNLDIETSHLNFTNLYYELRELLETKQLYLNPNLNLEDLVKELNTNKNYLYYAIKSNYEDNFRSLLNDYRINYFKSMIVETVKDNKKINMIELQESSGFQSTATFFRVFKSKTGLTPLEYLQQVKLKK
jgi:AraC-like DNA-binding protein